MYSKLFLVLISLFFLISCSGPGSMTSKDKPLLGVNITIDPGHGDTKAYDNFRVGPTGEREEWINLRVAKYLTKKLIGAGANVLMTREHDKDVSLGGRATLAKRHHSDLLISIHHNGSKNDLSMDLPIVYFFGPASLNPASVDFAEILLKGMRQEMDFEQPLAGAVYSDHLIYSSGTSILRNTIDDMPGVIGEGGFFTHVDGELRLKSKAYNKFEAEVYFQAILKYFDRGIPYARPLTPDTLSYLDLSKALQFKLDDGYGSTFFVDSSFKALQNGEELRTTWYPMEGVLETWPVFTDEKEVTFQVFGRNLKGNAIHPCPFVFLTEHGFLWYSVEKWQTAFDNAELLFSKLESPEDILKGELTQLINEALHFYQLSLELQIVHPQARIAEERILTLLNMKQDQLGINLTIEIEIQAKRIEEFYPN